MLSMLGGFAEFERKRIVERMMDGKHQLAEQGGWNGGFLPFGYKHCQSTGKIVISEEDARIVQDLFKLYSRRGLSMNKIKTATHCPLHRDTIYDLLSNPFYVGLIKYGKHHFVGEHNPLVSNRLFNKVQEMKLSRMRSDKESLFKICGTSLLPLRKVNQDSSCNV